MTDQLRASKHRVQYKQQPSRAQRRARAGSANAPAPTGSQARHLQNIRDLKERYANGEPLEGPDEQYMTLILNHHPRAAEKIGPGVAGFVVDEFISGTRCFFVIRKDGSAVDFSAPYCITKHRDEPTAKARAAMAAWDLRIIVRRALQRGLLIIGGAR